MKMLRPLKQGFHLVNIILKKVILEKQMFPIFNKDKSILLARPQTPKTNRVSHRQKKNAAALQI
jgi:hypothetical protein